SQAYRSTSDAYSFQPPPCSYPLFTVYVLAQPAWHRALSTLLNSKSIGDGGRGGLWKIKPWQVGAIPESSFYCPPDSCVFSRPRQAKGLPCVLFKVVR